MKRLELKNRISKISGKIPIPKRHLFKRRVNYGTSIYPVKELKIGESFGIKIRNDKERSKLSSYLCAIVESFRRKGFIPKKQKYTVRQLKKEVRVWRIK